MMVEPVEVNVPAFHTPEPVEVGFGRACVREELDQT